MQITANNWPYPRWIAHRGAGKLAPENTLAAFRLGAQHGYRMFECDVKLSADGVPFLLHDDTLERTSTGSGLAGRQPWSALAQLDAGGWHSRSYAGEPIPTLDNIAAFCQRNSLFLNIEIKPSPDTDRLTGEKVADAAARLWQGQAVPPLLTSFSVASLQGAQSAQPSLPRGLLLDTLWDGWLDAAQRLGCIAIVCNHTLWTADTLAQVQAAGLRSASYTVNDAVSVQRLIALGTDAIITDRIDLFAAAA